MHNFTLFYSKGVRWDISTTLQAASKAEV